MRVAFLLRDLELRPGVGALVAHAAAVDGARIVLTREQEALHWAYPGSDGVAVVGYAAAVAEGPWDVVVCGGGATASAALALDATRHVCLLVEDDHGAGVHATSLPFRFLTPTAACAALVTDLQPGNAPLHVPTVVSAAPPASARAGVLTVGAARPSHADHARAIAAASVVVALDDTDPYDSVLLALASGTPVVTWADDEHVTHGVDGLLVDRGDRSFVADASTRAALLSPPPRPAADATIVAALERVLAEPPPPASALGRRVAADLASPPATAPASPPTPPVASALAPSFARRAARAAKRRLRR